MKQARRPLRDFSKTSAKTAISLYMFYGTSLCVFVPVSGYKGGIKICYFLIPFGRTISVLFLVSMYLVLFHSSWVKTSRVHLTCYSKRSTIRRTRQIGFIIYFYLDWLSPHKTPRNGHCRNGALMMVTKALWSCYPCTLSKAMDGNSTKKLLRSMRQAFD